MRKIEQQMNEAIRSGNNWKSANTEVVITDDTANVYLHGHHIATVCSAIDCTLPNRQTFREWPTATTRSRLRALGVDASIKNFQACIDGREL